MLTTSTFDDLSKNENASYGAVFGALIGDAAGATLEFLRRKPSTAEVEDSLRMIGGGVWGTAPGQITDDGELTLAALHGLSGKSNYSLDRVAAAYIAWAQSSPFDIGITTSNALLNISPKKGNGCGKAVLDASAALNLASKANGALMRASSLAVWSARVSVEDAIALARLDTRLTHPNISCQFATAAYVVAIRHLILFPGDQNGALCAAADTLRDEAATEVQEWLNDAISGIEVHCYPLAGFVKIAFMLAFQHLAKGSPFQVALHETLLGGGDTDTNACIVGGLMGALHGVSAIPSVMTESLLSCDTSMGRPRPVTYRTKELLSFMKSLMKII
jgi:ADP-ribosyl-[dinitrogen reductase] hydrolase